MVVFSTRKEGYGRAAAPAGGCRVSSSLLTIHTTVAVLRVTFTTNGPPTKAGAAESAAAPARNRRSCFILSEFAPTVYKSHRHKSVTAAQQDVEKTNLSRFHQAANLMAR